MKPMEKHLIDIEVKAHDKLPDGAFFALMEEKGISVDTLAHCYDHDEKGYCLCVKCINHNKGTYRGKWNGPEDKRPPWLPKETKNE